MLFHWRFDPVTEHQTRLTQRIELWGENAATYVDGIRSGFEPNLEPGMRRLAGLMESRFCATDTNGASVEIVERLNGERTNGEIFVWVMAQVGIHSGPYSRPSPRANARPAGWRMNQKQEEEGVARSLNHREPS